MRTDADGDEPGSSSKVIRAIMPVDVEEKRTPVLLSVNHSQPEEP
jgi:hypothetical protein